MNIQLSDALTASSIPNQTTTEETDVITKPLPKTAESLETDERLANTPCTTNSNQLVADYLHTLVEINSHIPVANEHILFNAQLNFSIGSLRRIDTALEQLKHEKSADFTDYKNDTSQHNFLLVLAFYIGEMAAKYKHTSADWYTQKQFKTAFPSEPSLANTLTNTYVAVINQQLFKPIDYILRTLFRSEKDTLLQFFKQNLNQSEHHKLAIAVTKPTNQNDNIHQPGNNPATNKTPEIIKTRHDSHKTHENENTNHQSETVVPTQPSAQQTDNTQTLTYQPNMLNSSEIAQADTVITNDIHTSQTPTQLSVTPSPLKHTTKTKQTENLMRATKDVSKLVSQFKPRVLPTLFWSLPCIAILGYSLYSMLLTKAGFSTGNIIITVIFALILIALWVNYAMSNISVFNNKVTVTSLIQNKAAIFDHETRFFHLPAAAETGLGKWFGTPATSQILTGQDTLSVTAQNHDALEDALLELELTQMLAPTLSKLDNGETVVFGQIQLTKDLIVYGKKGLAVNRVADYDIDSNDFIILDNDNNVFARVALSGQPNINTLVSAIEQLQTA